ncbi:MAG: thiolase family protein [Myxococcota bacterium]|nr:thiolase family protein [Myxococcota bacterium]
MASAAADWGRASELDDVAGKVAIAGVGESLHSPASGRNSVDIAIDAVEAAIADAGLTPGDVDGLMCGGGMGGQLDEPAFRQHFSAKGFDGPLWTSGEGGGMVWAATAPVRAARALSAGEAKVIVNVFSVAWATQRKSGEGDPGMFHAAERFKANLELPFGWFPQPVYFATIARRHMHEYGTRPEQLGAIAVSCRRHANMHPGAVMHDKPLSLDEHLAQPMLVDPLRLTDCCLISDGGAAYVMTTPERARDMAKPPVLVAGVGEGHSNSGTYWSQQGDFTATPQVFSAPAAFEMAGVTPADVDLLTLYDPFTIVALMQIEDMGFCKKGEGGAFVEGSRLHNDGGGLPYNTHGGLLSHAYVLGIAHVVEVVRQLRREASAQVPDAEIGVYGGYTGHMASTLVLRRDT